MGELPPAPARPRFWTVAAVAKRMGLSTRTVRRYCEERVIDALQTPGGHWRIPDDALRALLGDANRSAA